MASKQIIYTRPDGIAAIFTPSNITQHLSKCVPRRVLEDTTITVGVVEPTLIKAGDLIRQSIAELNKVPTEAITYEIIDAEDVPADRRLRDIWHHDTSAAPQKVGVRVAEACSVSLSRVRAARDAAFAVLDRDYDVALRTGVGTAHLDLKRQKLLDATEELKALDTNDDGLVSVDEVADKVLTVEQKALTEISI